jgi:hypothetical protein
MNGKHFKTNNVSLKIPYGMKYGPDKKYKLFYTENPICYEMVMKKKDLSNKKFYIENPIWYETDNK